MRVGSIGQRRPPHEVQDLVVALFGLRSYRAEVMAALLGRKDEVMHQY